MLFFVWVVLFRFCLSCFMFELCFGWVVFCLNCFVLFELCFVWVFFCLSCLVSVVFCLCEVHFHIHCGLSLFIFLSFCFVACFVFIVWLKSWRCWWSCVDYIVDGFVMACSISSSFPWLCFCSSSPSVVLCSSKSKVCCSGCISRHITNNCSCFFCLSGDLCFSSSLVLWRWRWWQWR